MRYQIIDNTINSYRETNAGFCNMQEKELKKLEQDGYSSDYVPANLRNGFEGFFLSIVANGIMSVRRSRMASIIQKIESSNHHTEISINIMKSLKS